jgi:predicted O-methyltransferase YrrM
MHERLFAVAANGAYFPGLQALLNSVHAYHAGRIPVRVYLHGFDEQQLESLKRHPLSIEIFRTGDLPLPVLGIWEAKQQVFAHAVGVARCVCLLDADLVLTSPLDDIFELAAEGHIVSSSDGGELLYGPDYAVYGPRLPGMKHAYINTGALCLDVVRHWDLVGLWAFASKYGAYSPGRGAPLALPGHGDQGTFNAVAALLNKTEHYHILPEGPWCDCTKGCTVRIRSCDDAGRLQVWNETESVPQRLVHSSGPKWWTELGVRHLSRFGDKLACFHHFARHNGYSPALPPRVELPLQALAARPRLRILIGICSAHRYPDRRQAVRETWLGQLPPDVAALFFIGAGGPCNEPGVVALPVSDDYQQLSAKVHCFYRYALEHYEFDYLFKCDDDTYVHAERLSKLPRPDVDLLGSNELEREGFASGGAGYLLSRNMVEHLVREPVAARPDEDVLFSRRALASALRVASTSSLQGFGDHWPEPGNEIVTAHWCGPFEMRRIHAGLTGMPPGPLLLTLQAQHQAWSGTLRLYSDGSFWSRGPASPNGSWLAVDAGQTLVLNWYHWPAELLALRPWGFEAPNFRLQFDDPNGPEQWDRIAHGGARTNGEPGQNASGLLLVLPILSHMRQIEGWLTDEEADLLIAAAAGAVRRFGDSLKIVEVGSYCGRSTVVLASAIKILCPRAKVYAIDPHDGTIGDADQGLQSLPPTLDRFKRNLAEAGVVDHVEILPIRSLETAWDQPIGMLFIDGLHDYANVARDFRHFEQWLSPDAYIAFHDYAPHYPGVQTAVAEILRSGGYQTVNCRGSMFIVRKRGIGQNQGLTTLSEPRP